MSNKWEDEFDFDEAPKQKNLKKDSNNKKPSKSNENGDYFDLEEDDKAVKLPNIAKNQAKVK